MAGIVVAVQGRVWHRAAMEDYREVNRSYWDDRVAAHAASEGYGQAIRVR
jgi:hypothetical protein